MADSRVLPFLALLASVAILVFGGCIPALKALSESKQAGLRLLQDHARERQRWISAAARSADPAEPGPWRALFPLEEAAPETRLRASLPEGPGAEALLEARRLASAADSASLARRLDLLSQAISAGNPPLRRLALFERADAYEQVGRMADALLDWAQLMPAGEGLAPEDRCEILARRVDALMASDDIWSASELSLQLYAELVRLHPAALPEIRAKTERRLRAWLTAETPPFPEFEIACESLFALEAEVRQKNALVERARQFLLAERASWRDGRSVVSIPWDAALSAVVIERGGIPWAALVEAPAAERPAETQLPLPPLALAAAATVPIYGAALLLVVQGRRHRRRERAVFDLARELKNPIARMDALSESLLGPRTHDFDAVVAALRREMGAAEKSVARVLELARIVEGRPLVIESLDPKALLEEVARSLPPMPIDAPPSLPRIAADGRALAMALSSCASALLEDDQTATSKRLLVGCEGQSLILGIESKDALKLAIPTSPYDSPVGMGLWLARRVAREHGGSLSIQHQERAPQSDGGAGDSDRRSGLTRILLSLPLTQDHRDAAQAETSATELSPKAPGEPHVQ